MLLDVSSLSKSFGQTLAVSDVSFSVDRGEVIALIGASGSGKTTTLRMINRLIEPDSGQVSLDGKKASEVPAHHWRRRIGYVVQGAGLFPHFSIFENVGITPALQKRSPADIKETVISLLDMVGLPAQTYADRKPAQLSGGQQQRVNLARALAGHPSLVLMDEPFGALDAITKSDLIYDLLSLRERLGFAAVIVTHDLSEALRFADRIGVMEGGHLIQMGTIETLIRAPAASSVSDMLDAARRHSAEVEAAFSRAGPSG
ncbi:MAG: glycine/betaine ABC transporter ATP-binding protein [Ponticaulis sp.]|nr:glycine/betaine ABC transporter ATP-binding protein [Ponticaulis sp.]